MPRFVKGDIAIETAIPREAVELRAQGFVEHVAKTAEVKQADAAKAETPAADTAASPKSTK